MLFNFQPFEPYSHASSNRSITKMNPVLKELWPGTANHFFLYKWRSNFHPQLVQNAKKKKKRKVFKTIAKWMWCSPIVWADFWIYSSLINIPDLYNSDPKYTFSWTQTTKLFSGVKQNQTKRRNHIQPVAKRNWRGFDTFISTGLNNPSRCLNIFEPVHTSLTLFLFHKNQIDSVLHLAHVFSLFEMYARQLFSL